MPRSGKHATPRPAPPWAKTAAPARPDPKKFQHCPAPKILLECSGARLGANVPTSPKGFVDQKLLSSIFYRTQVSLGFDLWVGFSLSPSETFCRLN